MPPLAHATVRATVRATALAATLSVVLCARGAGAQAASPAATHPPVVATHPPADDEAGVRAALEHYLAGHRTGSPDAFRQAFHPDARMVYRRDGAVRFMPIAEYIANASGRPAADEAQRRRRIVRVDVAGTAAVARLELDYPATRFVDFMALVKDGERWVIVEKTVYAEPTRAAPR